MGSSSPAPDQLPDPAFVRALAAVVDATGFVSFEQFMQLALYHPELGFYTRDQTRVGRDGSSHFFTASSLGPIFGELVVAACVHQLATRGADPAGYTFVEIGAERGQTVLDGIDHPFAKHVGLGIDSELSLSGPCIVFSNELFDAQPCARYIRTASGWDERGVTVTADGNLAESRRPATIDVQNALPSSCAEGYELDLPRAADALASRIAQQPWNGLFMAFDYGKSWHELTTETPQGTARAYFHHRQNNDLLARPGYQDLTCHVCWDTIADSLRKAGFSVAPVLSQEAFFVKNTASLLAKIIAEEAHTMTARKSGLMQLLHPSALGQKFQVITAWHAAD